MRHRRLLALPLCFTIGLIPLALATPSDPFAGALPSRETKPPEGVTAKAEPGVATQQGAATYSYPLEVPSARGNMVPHLSLDYSSNSPLRGGLAVGWSLGGLPTIERDPTNDVDTTRPSYRYGGELMIQVDGDPGTGTRYRLAHDEGMTRIWLDGVVWKVATPDGVLRTYLGPSGNGSNGLTIWNMSREQDAAGNLVTYTWASEADDYWLTAIDYGGNVATGVAHHARVELTMVAGPVCSSNGLPVGAQLDHHTGRRLVRGGHRLDAITIKVRDVPGGPLRRTRESRLTYNAAESSCSNDRPPLRVLDQIDTTAYDADRVATAAPPIRLGYNPMQRDLSRVITPGTTTRPSVTGLGDRGTDHGPEGQMMDLDGDAVLDQVRVADPAPGQRRCRMFWRRGFAGGFFANSEQQVDLPTAWWGPDNEAFAEQDHCTLDGQTAFWGGGYHGDTCFSNAIAISYRWLDLDHDGDLDLATSTSLGGEAQTNGDWPALIANTTDPDPTPTCDPGHPTATGADCGCGAGETPDGFGGCRPQCSQGQHWDHQDQACVNDDDNGDPFPPQGPPPPGGEPPGTASCRPDGLSAQHGMRVFISDGGTLLHSVDGTYVSRVIDTPEALPSSGNMFAPATAGPSALSSLVDVDGDGWLDFTSTLGFSAANANNIRVWRGVPDQNGFTDFTTASTLWSKPQWVDGGNTVSPVGSSIVTSGSGTMWEDFDGDGLVDIVGRDVSGNLLVSYNQQGSFAAVRDLGIVSPTGESRTELQIGWNGVPALQPAWRADTRSLLDVDDDGLAELTLIAPESGQSVTSNASSRIIYRFNGDRLGNFAFRTPSWEPLERQLHAVTMRSWHRTSDYVDLTGDGLPDLVTFTPDGVANVRTDQIGAPPIRLLASIDNGRGAITRFTYARSSDATVVTAPPGTYNPRRWVVSRMATSPGGSQPELRTTYRYARPTRGTDSTVDRSAPHFVGYAQVTTERGGQQGDASSRTIDTFGYAVVSGDGRGHLLGTWKYVANGAGWAPVSVEASHYARRHLLDGLAGFTFRDVHTTRTCGAGATDAQCAVEALRITTDRESWTPYLGTGTLPILYTQTQTSIERPVGTAVERRTTVRDYQVRAGQAPYAAADYRVLPILEEQQRTDGGTLSRTMTSYSPSGLPVETLVWTGWSSYHRTQRTFDAAGNIVTVKRPLQFANGTNNLVQYAYDAFGHYPARTTNELGHVVLEVHDVATGVLMRREGPNNRTVPGRCALPPCIVYAPEEWKLDGFGRVLEHRVATDPATGGGYALTPIEWTTYTDGVTSTRRTQSAIDLTGAQRVTTLDAFDGMGRVTRHTEIGAVGAFTAYSYDAGGALRSLDAPSPTNDSARVITTYDRDGLGRVTRLVRPDGTWQTVTYLGADVETQEVSPSDGIGARTRSDLDAFGRLAAVHEPDAAGDHVTTYGYDAAGRMTSMTDADGATTTMEYSWAGQRTAMTRGARRWTYGYDANGNLASQISPIPGGPSAPYTSTTTYDDLDRPLVHTPAPRALTAAQRTQLGIGAIANSYDSGANAIGAPSRVTLPFGTFDYAYDVRGQIKREQRTIGTSASGYPVTATQYVDRTYNATGAPLDVTWDDGTSWRTGYSARGLVADVSWLDPAAGYRSVATYTRGALGQARIRTNAYAQNRAWTYDVLGRVATDQVSKPGTILAERNYGYDGFGRLGAVSGAINSVTADATFDYDGRGRIAVAEGPGAYTAAMTYSPAGNVTRATVTGALDAPARDVLYQYGATDRQAVDRLVNPNGSSFAQLTHDLAGNLMTRTINGSTWNLVSDGDDLIRKVSGPQGDEIYYFGPGGERVAAITSTGVKLWFAESETHYTTTGVQTVRWHHLAAGESLARVENRTAIELQYSDALRNLMVTVSPAGTVTSSFLYGAFGEVVASTGAATHRRGFNGKEADTTSGLRAYGYRSYDPVLLRWTAADPKYRFAPDAAFTEPQRANLYAFSLNNPLRYYDHDGRDPATDRNPRPRDAPCEDRCEQAHRKPMIRTAPPPTDGWSLLKKVFTEAGNVGRVIVRIIEDDGHAARAAARDTASDHQAQVDNLRAMRDEAVGIQDQATAAVSEARADGRVGTAAAATAVREQATRAIERLEPQLRLLEDYQVILDLEASK